MGTLFDMAGPVHRVVVETEIAAPPQRVWDLVTDITLLPRFSTELQSVEWDRVEGDRVEGDRVEGDRGAGSAGLGARFLGTNRHPAIGEWTTRSVVDVFDPLRSFGWAVGDPEKPAATWRFDIEPLPAGTRLSYEARLGDGRSGVTMMIDREPDTAEEIIARRLGQWRQGMVATVTGIKELAESG